MATEAVAAGLAKRGDGVRISPFVKRRPWCRQGGADENTSTFGLTTVLILLFLVAILSVDQIPAASFKRRLRGLDF
jgi:hypothetical protein